MALLFSRSGQQRCSPREALLALDAVNRGAAREKALDITNLPS